MTALMEIHARLEAAAFKGNCYWGNAFSVNGYSNFNTWANSTGQEKIGSTIVGMWADPGLTDPGSGGTVGDPSNLASLAEYKLKSSSVCIDAEYKLKSSSVCIDAGLNESSYLADMGGRDFYINAIVGYETGPDIGAHEYYDCDFDDSGKVDLSDFAELSRAWLSSSGQIEFNYTADLYVNDTTVRS